MLPQLRTSIVVLVLLTLLTGVAYPSLVTLIARLTFSHQAHGSILEIDGKTVGSELLGQPFSRPEYFWGRLSATAPFPYNAAASSGSNFGPRHPDLVKNAQARMDALRALDSQVTSIPVDVVTASGSGLDPHISRAAAEVQVRRVAGARMMMEDEVRELVRRNTAPRQWGVLGEPRVHVLRLNIALDALTHDRHATRSR